MSYPTRKAVSVSVSAAVSFAFSLEEAQLVSVKQPLPQCPQ